MGSTSYGYDQLSRMTAETRQFTGFGSYSISYQYNLAGELSSVADPFNATINYTRDNSGRLTAVTPGSPFADVTTYASDIQYRAWGAIKHLQYGNNRTLDATYNSRLQAATSGFPRAVKRLPRVIGNSSHASRHRNVHNIKRV